MLHRFVVTAMVCLFLLSGNTLVLADDSSSLRDELGDLRCKVGGLEAARAPAGGGDAASLTSLRKKASIQIGGDGAVDLIYKHRDDQTSDSDEVDSTEFHTNSANLRFKVSSGANTFLYIKLDLDDSWDSALDGAGLDQDDLLEEVKFVWNNVRNSGWGFVFGKGEVPYGQDKTLGIIQSFHHNDETYSSEGPGFLLAGTEQSMAGDAANPHANVGRVAHPGEVDNVYMIGANVNYRDFLRFEIALFQNNDNVLTGGFGRGLHEDRSDDHLGFQSFAARLWMSPVENLRMQLSFIREYNDTAGDAGLTGNNWAEEDQCALSFGFTYRLGQLPLELFGEYQHGWDWNYTDDYDTNTYQLGLIWSATESCSLGVMGEWLDIDDDNNDAEEDYGRVVLSAKHRLQSRIYMVLEYGYEWWDGDFDNADDQDRSAHMVAFRTGWAF